MRIFISLLLLSIALGATAQSLSGEVRDETGMPLPSSTVVLLDPVDSTMQYFGITNSDGLFEIKGINKANYLLQAAYIGHQTYYKNITIPLEDGEFGMIILAPLAEELAAVQITGERIPLKVSQDTLEYDAKAFKSAPDDNVEDLLKKLPGIEVDRSGNITALGEEVRNVLVDGKEFFSNDPKIATKNLPAGALDKVQLYNKQTEEAEFTGIDDGSRNQTLNLILNKENKDGLFGSVLAGGGSGGHYDANAKVYKFTDKAQIAGLGMINNVNKFGFSIRDYISFSGGIENISHGKGGDGGGGSFPVNYGQSQNGIASSGAAGLNYSYFKSKYQRFFISYLGSGSKIDLQQQTSTWRYKQDSDYFEESETDQIKRDTSHNITFGLRYLFRETNNLIVNGGMSYQTAYIPLESSTSSYMNDLLVNDQTRMSNDLSDRLSGNMNATYLKKIQEGRTILKVSGNGSYSSDNSETDFMNNTSFYDLGLNRIVNQFQDNHIKTLRYGGALSLTRRLFEAVYMDLGANVSNSRETLDRVQGEIVPSEVQIDSLSPEFIKINQSINPSLTLKRSTDLMSMSIGLEYNLGNYNTVLWDDEGQKKTFAYLQPRFHLMYRYKTGRRLSFRYSTSMNTPSANQLLPIVNNFNSLSLFYGNRSLEPEYRHSANVNWWIFDQFSFTTFLIGLNTTYTQNKINFMRSVNEQLVQEVRLINVDSDFSASGNIDFSTPIRALGIQTNLDLSESFNQGLNIVNDVENEVTSFTHKASVSFDNRKKEKVDVIVGMGATMTDARYSIQTNLNNVYYDLSWFGELRYNPIERLEMYVSTDITNYTAKSFEESQLIPLLGAHVSFFFLKNNRGTLTLAGADLLNKNTGIQRVSEMNYLQERTSNIIGRYFMLSFKYNLNKFGGGNDMDIKVKMR